MSNQFRDLLKKIGSGPHTGKNLTREEACQATLLMLNQEATPAQIGAFLIAHRIKRPTGEELAGMLDAYDQLGPRLPAIKSEKPVIILSQPYDGRDRTFPLSPLTALMLAAADCPIIQHGGNRMPTKEGVPLVDIWQSLGVDWKHFSLSQIHDILEETKIGFIYIPHHFTHAQNLVPYREQIGKRPPLATLELIWSPYAGLSHIVAGFVHPPTENMIKEALILRGIERFTTVKGLEGSCDLPQDRTAIIGLHSVANGQRTLTRLCLHGSDYNLGGKNVPWTSLTDSLKIINDTLEGEITELRQALLWNSGFYLWQHTDLNSLDDGIVLAKELIDNGKVKAKLQQLQQIVKKLLS